MLPDLMPVILPHDMHPPSQRNSTRKGAILRDMPVASIQRVGSVGGRKSQGPPSCGASLAVRDTLRNH